MTTRRVIVIGAGHNGLVCAAYLARSGVETVLVEKRDVVGGVVGSYEYMPGYRSSITNSPGSFEARITGDLDLPRHGLKFFKPRITVAQRFGDKTFVGFRDRERIAEQIDAFAPGEYSRYRTLIDDLNRLGRETGLSIWRKPDSLQTVRARLTQSSSLALFDQVIDGSLRDLLDRRLRSEQAKSLLMMLALPGTLLSSNSPGSALTLLMRPISMASLLPGEDDTANSLPLRGSVGTPIGSMAAIVDSLAAAAKEAGARVITGNGVKTVLKSGHRVTGVELCDGAIIEADRVISTVEPSILQSQLVESPDDVVHDFTIEEPKGAAFKLALALDGLPAVPGLPDDVTSSEVLGSQIRIGNSPDHIESSIEAGIRGEVSSDPIMWGLVPSIVSPQLAPHGRHLLSLNVWHAPHALGEPYWDNHRDEFATLTINKLDEQLPGLSDRVVDYAALSPIDLDREFGLTGSEITHGKMTVNNFFADRTHPSLVDRETSLRGLYLGGAETWPGGYVTGVPGRNAADTVIRDLEERKKGS